MLRERLRIRFYTGIIWLKAHRRYTHALHVELAKLWRYGSTCRLLREPRKVLKATAWQAPTISFTIKLRACLVSPQSN